MSIWLKIHPRYPEHILMREFNGEVNVEQIMQSWKLLLKSKLLHDGIMGVVNNLLTCKLNMSLEEFDTLTQFLNNHPRLCQLKHAVVTNNPQIVVFPMMGEMQQKSLKIKPFATEEAAVKWIMEGVPAN